MKVKESISELKEICQVSFRGWKKQPWVFLQIRKMSIYLTWVLLHLRLTANNITLLGIATGLFSSVLFGLNHLIGAAVTLLFSILLDFSDGEVGRYRKQLSKEGAYLDKMYHFSVHSFIFAGATIGAYQIHPSTWIVIVGFVNVISVFLLSTARTYAKSIALWKHCSRLFKALNAEGIGGPNAQFIISNFINDKAGMETTTNKLGGQLQQAKRTGLGHVFSILSNYWDFPYILIVIIIVAFIQFYISELDICGVLLTPFEMVLLFYAATYPFLIVTFLFYNLLTKAIGRDYNTFLKDFSSLMVNVSKK